MPCLCQRTKVAHILITSHCCAACMRQELEKTILVLKQRLAAASSGAN